MKMMKDGPLAPFMSPFLRDAAQLMRVVNHPIMAIHKGWIMTNRTHIRVLGEYKTFLAYALEMDHAGRSYAVAYARGLVREKVEGDYVFMTLTDLGVEAVATFRRGECWNHLLKTPCTIEQSKQDWIRHSAHWLPGENFVDRVFDDLNPELKALRESVESYAVLHGTTDYHTIRHVFSD